MKPDRKFYTLLREASNTQHSAKYARFYKDEDQRSKDDISHSGKCKIIKDLSASFDKSPTVLDLGCGTGRYFHCLHKVKSLVGLDPSRDMLMMAKDPLNQSQRTAQLVQGSIQELAFKRESFDLIVCIGVLGVVCPADQFTMNHIAEYLKNNSIFFFTVPEYVPTPQTWKRAMGQIVEPFLFGDLKRYVKIRLRRFAVSENALRKLLPASLELADLSRWTSGTGRIDLHCVVRKIA